VFFIITSELCVNIRTDVDKHGVLAEAAYLFPRDNKLLALAKAEQTAIKKHDKRAHLAAARVYFHIVHKAEPLAVANVYNVLVTKRSEAFPAHK
jgi:hypothetical protein